MVGWFLTSATFVLRMFIIAAFECVSGLLKFTVLWQCTEVNSLCINIRTAEPLSAGGPAHLHYSNTDILSEVKFC